MRTLRTTPWGWRSWGAAALSSLVCLTPPATAQSIEYSLDDDGGKWTQIKAPEPGSDEAVIADARRELASEQPAAAVSILTGWLNPHELSDNRWLSTAHLIRGDAYLAMGKEFKALYDYEAVITQFAQSEEFTEANERELRIAILYANGLRIKFWGVRVQDSGDTAVEFLIRVQERLPGSALAERAAIELADFYFRRRQMDLAREAYDLYLINFPKGPNRMRAMERQIYANIALFKGPDHDSSSLLNAQEQIRRFRSIFPAQAEQSSFDSLQARLDESLAAQMLAAAQWYMDRHDGPASRLTLRRLVRKHPRSLAASRAIEILGKHGWLQGQPTTPEASDQQGSLPQSSPDQAEGTQGGSLEPAHS